MTDTDKIPGDSIEVHLLKEFLIDQRKLKDRGLTLETVYEKLENVSEAIEVDKKATSLRLDRYGGRLRRLEKANSISSDNDSDPPTSEDDEESKIHRLQESQFARDFTEMKKEIKEEGKRKLDEGVWWQHQRWIWVGAIMLALFGCFGSACTGLIVWKVTQPPQTPVATPK
jgi:hypothetical protein